MDCTSWRSMSTLRRAKECTKVNHTGHYTGLYPLAATPKTHTGIQYRTKPMRMEGRKVTKYRYA